MLNELIIKSMYLNYISMKKSRHLNFQGELYFEVCVYVIQQNNRIMTKLSGGLFLFLLLDLIIEYNFNPHFKMKVT